MSPILLDFTAVPDFTAILLILRVILRGYVFVANTTPVNIMVLPAERFINR